MFGSEREARFDSREGTNLFLALIVMFYAIARLAGVAIHEFLGHGLFTELMEGNLDELDEIAERLKEAKSTGADFLITACNKCQVHFRCAQQDSVLPDDIRGHIKDFTTLIAGCLKQKKVQNDPLEEKHAAQLGAR